MAFFFSRRLKSRTLAHSSSARQPCCPWSNTRSSEVAGPSEAAELSNGEPSEAAEPSAEPSNEMAELQSSCGPSSCAAAEPDAGEVGVSAEPGGKAVEAAKPCAISCKCRHGLWPTSVALEPEGLRFPRPPLLKGGGRARRPRNAGDWIEGCAWPPGPRRRAEVTQAAGGRGRKRWSWLHPAYRRRAV